jgi:hypothetical protein
LYRRRYYAAGFEDERGKGPKSKECKRPLKAGENKEIDSPL